MADSVSMDLTDLYKLTAQLDNVGNEIPKGAVAAMRGGAFTAKRVWAEGLEASAVPASAGTLAYRFAGGGGKLTATVGNTQGTARMQGFVHAREYGSMTVAPGAPAQAAAVAAGEDLARGLAVAGENAIKRALGTAS